MIETAHFKQIKDKPKCKLVSLLLLSHEHLTLIFLNILQENNVRFYLYLSSFHMKTVQTPTTEACYAEKIFLMTAYFEIIST